RGDLSPETGKEVAARGEFGALRDGIRRMIDALAETTRVNREQDWLKTNLARFTRMLQGRRELVAVAEDVLSELAPTLGALHGEFYGMEEGDGGPPALRRLASYAAVPRAPAPERVAPGEGL